MTPKYEDKEEAVVSQAEFHRLLRVKMLAAVRLTLMGVLDGELAEQVGAGRYERSANRRDHRIGHRTRRLTTSLGVIEDLPVPRTRGGFQTQVFEKYQRRQAEIDELIGNLFIGGLSQAGVGQVLEQLNGDKPSPSTVSRVFHGLEETYAEWKRRALPERYLYVFADGTYFSVIYEGKGQKMPILALIGITPEGRREVIAFTTGERENHAAWCNLLDDIKARGVRTVDLWITDGHQAMLNAIELKFPDSARQRCMVHKLKNLLAHVPESQRDQVSKDFKAIFYRDNREKADQEAAVFRARYENRYPEAIACMDRDWEACLTFYAYPEAHWSRIRTTNVIERTFEEVKKRSKKMSAPFRNEGSCLLLFFAIVREIRFQNIAMPG
jgi:transposase-like protein